MLSGYTCPTLIDRRDMAESVLSLNNNAGTRTLGGVQWRFHT